MGTLPSDWLNATWKAGDGCTLIEYFDGDKRRRIVESPTLPYFFIRDEDLDRVIPKYSKRIAGVEKGDFVNFRGERCAKISVENPDALKNLRDDLEKLGVETFESDIPFIRRVMIDHNIHTSEIKERAYFDLEVDARFGFPDPNRAEYPIISIALVGTDGGEYFFSYKDEKQTISEFLEVLMKKYHLLSAWNLRRFDWPYLINRMRKLKMPIPTLPIQLIDSMLNYRKLMVWGYFQTGYSGYSGYKLENIAEQFLGESKEAYKDYFNAQAMWESYIGDKKILREYNVRDAQLVMKLDLKLGLSDYYIQLSKRYPLFLDDLTYVSKLIDCLILRTALLRRPRIILNRRKKGEQAKLLGAITLQPKPGIHHNVMVLDYKGLYNSIMVAANISPEYMGLFKEYNRNNLGEVDYEFAKRYVAFTKEIMERKILPPPIVPTYLVDVEKSRSHFKKIRDQYPEDSFEYKHYNVAQASEKLILVSSYGVIGLEGTRFFDPFVVNLTTFLGREILKKTFEVAASKGFEVLYGDTDSLFLIYNREASLEEVVGNINNVAEAINREVSQWLKETFGMDGDKIILEPKKIYSKLLFFSAKKKYIGECVWEEGILKSKKDAVGVEIKRSDSFPLLKDIQAALADIYFRCSSLDEVLDEAKFYLRLVRSLLYRGMLDEHLTFEKTMKMKIDDYKNANIPHIRVARKIASRGFSRVGDRITWVVTRADSSTVEEPVIKGEPFPKIFKSGYDYYWGRIIDLVKRMIPNFIDDIRDEVTIDAFT